MKEDVSIKVKIVDRVFPLKVSTQEEYFVRKAAKHIEERIRDMKDKYGIQENKDLLAMVALELATEQAKIKSANWIEDNGITEKIDQIDQMLSTYTS